MVEEKFDVFDLVGKVLVNVHMVILPMVLGFIEVGGGLSRSDTF